MTKYTFSGHETFYCRHYWLKKGYDFLKDENNFNDSDAVTKLGVGKNMVSSIKHWLKSFGLISANNLKPTELAQNIFNDEVGDTYMEDTNSLWLLHYYLVKNEIASIFNLFFNDIRHKGNEFSDENIEKGILNILNIQNVPQSQIPSAKTLHNDLRVFKSTYITPRNTKSIEDDFSGLLQELNLIRETEDKKITLINEERDDLSNQIILFTILDAFPGKTSISFEAIFKSDNSPGRIFCITENSLVNKIRKITELNKDIVFTENAGLRELQFKKQIDKWDILKNYYEQN